ncbi:MAG: cryptochrome/photolyase family protein [Verrucomicrobiota bacterium]
MVLRFVFGDQLSHGLTALSDIDLAADLVLLCEVRQEATKIPHHQKKIAFVFSAMRHFAAELDEQGCQVRYINYDDPENAGSFTGELERALASNAISRVIMTEPSEYDVLEEVAGWQDRFGLPIEIRDDDRFLCTKDAFAKWAGTRKQLRMEFFYREMRRDYDVLMDGEHPEGGKWNYDAENRKQPDRSIPIPQTYQSEPDTITQEVLDMVGANFAQHFGDLEPFHFAVNATQARQALDQFITERLGHFGDYQDAMLEGEPWMYHSHLSFYLNSGLLTAKECIDAAELAYRKGMASLNAVEGFIRQILGWREYIRGIYWLKMPAYAQANYLQADRTLPEFFWDGSTKMNCLRQCVLETKANAYAHHIQRLMVIGNFSLLAGLEPDAVNRWFWIVYADAYQWVELPNVSGMILFADGGVLASKPYAASGAYINRMSDYCKGCSYKVSKKNGPDACPFNYLYWDFLDRNRSRLESNPRLGMPYRTLGKMKEEKLSLVRSDSQKFLSSMDEGTIV